jgi:hypothetical protein
MNICCWTVYITARVMEFRFEDKRSEQAETLITTISVTLCLFTMWMTHDPMQCSPAETSSVIIVLLFFLQVWTLCALKMVTSTPFHLIVLEHPTVQCDVTYGVEKHCWITNNEKHNDCATIVSL